MSEKDKEQDIHELLGTLNERTFSILNELQKQNGRIDGVENKANKNESCLHVHKKYFKLIGATLSVLGTAFAGIVAGLKFILS